MKKLAIVLILTFIMSGLLTNNVYSSIAYGDFDCGYTSGIQPMGSLSWLNLCPNDATPPPTHDIFDINYAGLFGWLFLFPTPNGFNFLNHNKPFEGLYGPVAHTPCIGKWEFPPGNTSPVPITSPLLLLCSGLGVLVIRRRTLISLE